MKVAILGAGAMGSALTIPYSEKNEVVLWGTEYDVPILEKIRRGEKHPRIDERVAVNDILNPDELDKALNADILVIAVSTEGVMPIFEQISDSLKDQVIITLAKGFIDEGEILTIPQAIWHERKDLKRNIAAITGPSIAKEVAKKLPTHVVYSSLGDRTLKVVKEYLETDYYRISLTHDIVGCETASALKNVYSIAIAWIRGIESRKGNVTMNNLKGIIVTQALREIGTLVRANGGKTETVYDLTGIGDLIATFRGGRNGMLGELLGKGYDIDSALKELERRGVGVVEGYVNAERAYRLAETLDHKGKLKMEELPLLEGINDVLYNGKDAEEVIHDLF
ncbi:Glycerol-3-phosphate dehydrogenase [Geoglobus ahangari]|uniref:Glycerol-3-phosphate dehydrogenase n=1 Tax=Geoglobus ahangari TaxID=113653 RepID=A0A0F7ID68_9EURY|nr:NAD(P)-binding domain-containing protein [Geoglobus ahangari]AKG90865.1 Glycerol-3-phosphate dehydrogenase [Geoglobus ahangari]